jgi:hypothetical protein
MSGMLVTAPRIFICLPLSVTGMAEDMIVFAAVAEEVRAFLAQPEAVEIDPYDMRILVRALYTSGLTDDMNPVARRAAALRLRGSLRKQRDALAAIEKPL